MSTLRQILAIALTLASSTILRASDKVYPTRLTPQGWDNYDFAVCFYNANDIMTVRSMKLCSPGKVIDVKMCPTTTTFAALYQQGSKKEVSLFSFVDGQKQYTFHFPGSPTAIAYSANAKFFYIATDKFTINVYDLSKKRIIRNIRMVSDATRLTVSNNNYFVAGTDTEIVYVYNAETGRVRKVIEAGSEVKCVTFSKDNSLLAVLTASQLLLYDTKTFSLVDTYRGMGNALCCAFHPEGKYISVITAANKICLINIKQSDEREDIVSEHTGISHLSYAKPLKQSRVLIYNTTDQFVFHSLENLVPDYQQMVATEVEDKMDQWMKKMTTETMEEYQLRVNEETRAEQYLKYENEVVSRLADNRVQKADVSFGSYDPEQNILEVNFDNLPPIYLGIPQEDVAQLNNPRSLSFDKTVYGVNDNDQFELLYTEVTNNDNSKKYIYDNLEKQKLEYLKSEDHFVPLVLIQQSSMEEIKLQEIKEEVVTQAKESNLISEHTHIDVKTKVEASFDADGNKIMNYNIEFNYDVEQEFSAKEDFKPGEYNIEQSASALAMMRIIKKAFNNEFKQYIQPGKKVRIIITGAADALPISGKLAYHNEYGSHTDIPVQKGRELTSVNISEQSGITTNDQLAFVRALSTQHFLQQHLTEINSMQSEFDYTINVSTELGAEFRRVGVKFIFIDAFK